MAAAAEHEQVFSANVRRGVSCHSSKEMRKQYVEPANQFDIVSVSSRLADDMTVPTDIQLSRHRPCRHVVAGILGHVSAMLRAPKSGVLFLFPPHKDDLQCTKNFDSSRGILHSYSCIQL